MEVVSMQADPFHGETDNLVFALDCTDEDIDFGFDFTNAYFLESCSSMGSSSLSSSSSNTMSGTIVTIVHVDVHM